MRAPADGLGRRGSPRQPPLYEALFGIVTRKAAATLEGDASMPVESKLGTPQPAVENVLNLAGANLSDLKDEALVTEAVRGNSAAFEILFARYHQKMSTTTLTRLQHPEDPEDAVHQPFHTS